MVNRLTNSVISLTLMVVLLITFSITSFAQNSEMQNMATDIFNDKILTVPNTVKNFIVLIPNEAHDTTLARREETHKPTVRSTELSSGPTNKYHLVFRRCWSYT